MSIVPKRILVADDVDGVRDLTVEAVRLAGYSKENGWAIDEACNGKDAYTTFSRNRPYFMVVTDHQMPKMTGAAFLEAIKDENVPHRYLITANADELRAHATACQATLIAKPYQIRDLITKLASHYPADEEL